MPWPCFLIEPTGIASLELRRYTMDGCRSGYGHEGKTLVGTAPLIKNARGYIESLPNPPPTDPRWPVRCAKCGEPFPADAHYQHNQHELYQAPDGQRYTTKFGDAPPGAMWVAIWITPDTGWVGPDGLSLAVVLPSGEHWTMDCPSRDGGRWTRTGEPPRVTVRPSIATRNYHGFLTDGVLSDDLEGRTYPWPS